VIAIDAAVLIDLLADGPAADDAEACLRQALGSGPVVVCDVALAEICTALQQGAQALEALEEMGIVYSTTEAKAAIRAGEMQRRFRQRSGMPPGARLRSASDFIIGAHALLQCNALITHDEDFFRDYFKGLKIIVPSAT
jgi:predicted nucleic acid-binding protein